jgi:hypothetical protein
MSHYFGVNTNTINIIEQPKEKKGEKINSQKIAIARVSFTSRKSPKQA